MKFNTKTRYGLRTMIEVAMHGKHAGILQKEISEKQGISLKYLDPIIASLKASGLIMNASGRMSGYILARVPEQISIYDIYKAFEKELLIADCLSSEQDENQDYFMAARGFWDELNEIIKDRLQSVKLKDLADEQRDFNENNVENMFYI
jgi:Rrf2 family protein